MMLQNNYANLRRIVKNPKAYNRPSHTTLQNKRYSTSDYVIWFLCAHYYFTPIIFIKIQRVISVLLGT